MSNILSCEGCWKESEPCIIRICGEAPLSTEDDCRTLDKCRLHKRSWAKSSKARYALPNGDLDYETRKDITANTDNH